ncbi:hypothetical protein N431DRAFT_506226 [Stipitochalara longipes BDJ]|nr:hypothetical protein N431DRAFT_506226 [Stipitochalara longipes BDJ]
MNSALIEQLSRESVIKTEFHQERKSITTKEGERSFHNMCIKEAKYRTHDDEDPVEVEPDVLSNSGVTLHSADNEQSYESNRGRKSANGIMSCGVCSWACSSGYTLLNARHANKREVVKKFLDLVLNDELSQVSLQTPSNALPLAAYPCLLSPNCSTPMDSGAPAHHSNTNGAIQFLRSAPSLVRAILDFAEGLC